LTADEIKPEHLALKSLTFFLVRPDLRGATAQFTRAMSMDWVAVRKPVTLCNMFTPHFVSKLQQKPAP